MGFLMWGMMNMTEAWELSPHHETGHNLQTGTTHTLPSEQEPRSSTDTSLEILLIAIPVGTPRQRAGGARTCVFVSLSLTLGPSLCLHWYLLLPYSVPFRQPYIRAVPSFRVSLTMAFYILSSATFSQIWLLCYKTEFSFSPLALSTYYSSLFCLF